MADPCGNERPIGYFEFMRRQFRFSLVWVPAVIVSAYIQWRSGGFVRVAFVLLVGVPAMLFLATWWEWRKTRSGIS